MSRRQRQPRTLEEQARHLVSELEAIADSTGSDWPTAESLSRTAEVLKDVDPARAPIWARAAELLEDKEQRRNG